MSRKSSPKEALRSTKVSKAGSEQGLQFTIPSTGQGVWPHTAGLLPVPQRDKVGRTWEDAGQWKNSASFKNHHLKYLYLLYFDVLVQGLANFIPLAKSWSLPVLGIKFYWSTAMPISSCCLWLCLYYNSRIEQLWQKLKYVLAGPLQKKLADLCSKANRPSTLKVNDSINKYALKWGPEGLIRIIIISSSKLWKKKDLKSMT